MPSYEQMAALAPNLNGLLAWTNAGQAALINAYLTGTYTDAETVRTVTVLPHPTDPLNYELERTNWHFASPDGVAVVDMTWTVPRYIGPLV